MSVFQFLASNKVLDEIENQYVEYISINEAIKGNIEIEGFILNDIKIDRDEKNIMIFDSEDHLEELEIKNNMYYSSKYAKEYSNKQYFSQLYGRYTKSRAKQLHDYLANQLKDINEMEIWSIWLDEHKLASIKSININELSIEDLEFLDISKGYEKPKCLLVKN